MVYWLGFVVRQDNRSTVWIEEADEWCSLSHTKRPPLYFIDVLMRLSWLPSEFVLYTVVGLQADRCTWTLNAEKGFYVDPSHTHYFCRGLFTLVLPLSLSATVKVQHATVRQCMEVTETGFSESHRVLVKRARKKS